MAHMVLQVRASSVNTYSGNQTAPVAHCRAVWSAFSRLQCRRVQQFVDDVIPEPLGGAHRDPDTVAASLKSSLIQSLATLQAVPVESLVLQRRRRIANYGVFKEV